MINPSKIFDLFNDEKSPQIEKTLLALDNFPFTKILLFEKLISKYEEFKILNLELNKKNLSQIEEIKKLGEYLFFNKSFNLIYEVDIDDEDVIKYLKLYFNDKPHFLKDLITSINKTLNYFISTEEYEKCAFLSNLKEKIQKI